MKTTVWKMDYDPESLPDLLTIYYKRLFPYGPYFKWLTYGGGELTWFFKRERMGDRPVAETWRRVWGGRKKFSRTKISEKFSFSPQKFLMTFFSHRPGFFILRFFTVLNVIYDPFCTRKTTISEKNSLIRPFLLCSYFRAHPAPLLL